MVVDALHAILSRFGVPVPRASRPAWTMVKGRALAQRPLARQRKTVTVILVEVEATYGKY